MDLIPAVDLLDGGAVRLVQGDFSRRAATVTDPSAAIRDWVHRGVRWVHLVDLDGAREGRPVNRDLAARLAAAAHEMPGVRVELGGGLRSLDDIERALEAGVDVAVLGTAAVEDPSLPAAAAERWPDRVAASIDVRDDRVALDGWTHSTDTDPAELARSLAEIGLAHLIVTDVRRDGTRRGPNLSLLARMRAALPGTRLVAAGGIGAAEELTALAMAGIDGAIVGLALVDGSLPIEAALAASGTPATGVA